MAVSYVVFLVSDNVLICDGDYLSMAIRFCGCMIPLLRILLHLLFLLSQIAHFTISISCYSNEATMLDNNKGFILTHSTNVAVS